MQDLWLLSVKDLRWTATTTHGTGPSARHSMGFVGLDQGRILLFGGVDGKNVALDDLMLLDTLTAVWSTLEPSATKPSARYKMGIASAANNRVYVVGGKLSRWNSGESRYSWSGNGDLNAEYSDLKGNDDVWELQMTETQKVQWILRTESLYTTVCSAEYQDISAEATFCVGFKGLSGIGLASDEYGNLYMLGGNAAQASSASTEGATNSYSDGNNAGYSSATSTASAASFPYANFLKLYPEGVQFDYFPFTALSTEANNLCTSSLCKEFFGPSPADDMVMVADVSDGRLQLVFLHPSTGDWWQCAPSKSAARWVRNNGIVQGRSDALTPKAPTSFFAAIYTNSKLTLIGGGFRDTESSWASNTAPESYPFSIGNSMELDFTSGVWTDLDSSIKVSTPNGPCSEPDLICPVGTVSGTKWFCATNQPSMGGYSDGGSGSAGGSGIAAEGMCVACSNSVIWSSKCCEQSLCEPSLYLDAVSKRGCKDVCFGAGTRSVSAVTLRYGHGIAQGPAGPGTLILFGGTKGNIDNSRSTAKPSENRELLSESFVGVINAENDLWMYDNRKWRTIVVRGEKAGEVPVGRSFFGFLALPNIEITSTTFLLFGGFSRKRLPELSDTWKMTLALAGDSYTGTWKLIEPKGPSPSGRVGLGLVNSHDGKIHLFGGGVFDWHKIDDRIETLLFRAVIPSTDHHWVFNPSTDEWTKMSESGIVPSARCFSGFVNGQNFRRMSLFLFGGIDRNGNLLNDLWEYQTTSAQWREISSFLTGMPPSPRLGLALISDDLGDVYVVGGEGVNGGLRDFFKIPLPEDGAPLPTSRYEFLQIYDEVFVVCVLLCMRMQKWPSTLSCKNLLFCRRQSLYTSICSFLSFKSPLYCLPSVSLTDFPSSLSCHHHCMVFVGRVSLTYIAPLGSS